MRRSKSKLVSELDPRMKLLLVAVYSTAAYMAKSNWLLIWIYSLILVLNIACGLYKSATKVILLSCSLIILDSLLMFIPESGVKAGIRMIVFFLERMIVLLFMAGWMAEHLRISDFVMSLQNMHVPKGATVTLAVVFRYLPTVKSEFRSIKNTMKLRGIGLSLKNIVCYPIKTIEYVIVPLVIRSMTIADELAASAMTRGLDLTSKRTSYREVRLCPLDIAISAFFIAFILIGLAVENILSAGGL